MVPIYVVTCNGEPVSDDVLGRTNSYVVERYAADDAARLDRRYGGLDDVYGYVKIID